MEPRDLFIINELRSVERETMRNSNKLDVRSGLTLKLPSKERYKYVYTVLYMCYGTE